MKVIKIALISVIPLLSLAYLTVAGLHYITHSYPFSGSKFSQEKWEAAGKGKTDYEQSELDYQCIRGVMVEDLKKNYLKATITPEETVELLGETKNITASDGKSCLKYNLGMCSGLKTDYDSLVVCFKNNMLTKVSTIQH